MMPEKAIYEKYHRKMKELLKTCDMEGFLFVPDEIFDKFSAYFLKTVEKEAAFNLYRYTGLNRVDPDSNERIFSFDTDNLYLLKNGNQNDIFEGIAQTDYGFTTIEECITALSNVALLKCFTEDPRNNLMWAHYADSYKGICVEYDIRRASEEVKKMLFPVVYRKKPEHFISVDEILSGKERGDKDYLRDSKGIFSEKPFCWKYEKEWRIIRDDGACGNKWDAEKKGALLEMICPSSIILGCMAKPEFEKAVREHCEECRINLYKMKKDKGRYRLEKVPVILFDD